MSVLAGTFLICAKGISQAEMLAFLFGAARESEKLAKRVSHDCFLIFIWEILSIVWENLRFKMIVPRDDLQIIKELLL